MAKKNSKSGGNTPHIKGDELVQDINQLLVNLISDVANLNDDDIKPIDKYKRGEDIVMSAYANEHLQASFEVKVNNKSDRMGLTAVYEAEKQAERQARDKEQQNHLPYSLDAVAIVKADGKKPLCVIDFLWLMKLYRDRTFYKKAFLNVKDAT